MKDMTTGSPTKTIIHFAIPILLGNLLQLTYSIADTRIIGTFLGDEALAAVGATTVLSTLLLGFFIGMANGFAISISSSFGRKDFSDVNSTFFASLVMGIILVVLLSALMLIFLPQILSFLNVPTALLPDATKYIRIILAGLCISMMYNTLLASARAIGDSVTPLLTLCLSVGLNIAGDLLTLGFMKTGVWGAAASTVAAQFITMIICAFYLTRRYEFFRVSKGKTHIPEKEQILNMLTAGLSMGFMSSMISIGSMILQTSINPLGKSYIVAQSAARKITDVLMSVFVAIGNACTTYSSQNLGAGRKDRVIMGIHAGYKITCIWCIFVLLIVYAFAPMLVAAITGSTDQIMIDAADKYLKIDSLLYVLVALIFVQRHTLQGVGDKITPIISSGIEMIGKIILTVTLVPQLGYMGVILVEPIVWIFMIIPLIVRIRKWKRN